ncbi:lantibiotic dehydratase [Spirillospora sp. NBC_01491]|uniref:lantibiotic dehydratase n=1 Tax=Spirillospora sp. NBC_01491 TaxID=2976007 RepID=UPI002E34A608|nr:lantibiotic dehydratase [Spirillospora sp. NBC_01491]
MATRKSELLYRCADTAMVRAAPHSALKLPVWPDLTGDTPEHVAGWRTWLRAVWALEEVAEAIEQASPVLAREVAVVCSTTTTDVRRVRRTVLSVVRYVLRMTGRATPFGLFAGVVPASFDGQPVVKWGENHQVRATAGASWISEVIARLEGCPDLLRRLPLMTNSLVFVRGGRLVVPYPPGRHAGRRSVAEASLRHTSAVRIAMETARAPVPFGEVADAVAAAFPATSRFKVEELIASLVDRGALISSLHAASTTLDPLDHVVEQLEKAEAGELQQTVDLVDQLREIHAGLVEHNRLALSAVRRKIRTALGERMARLARVSGSAVVVDMRVDCSLILPTQVAREAEAATSTLARLTEFPSGSPGWRSFHNRFFERYGLGSLVPVRELVDPDIGLGFPAGYLGGEPEPREPVTVRQLRLLALAQAAALDGRQEIVLDEDLIGELKAGDRNQMLAPPHLELRFHLQAASLEALARGDFQLTVVGPSRGIGTTTSRFVGLLSPGDQVSAAAVLDQLPVGESGTRAVQLSFPPLDPGDAHVTRAPELLAATISLAEHRPAGPSVIGVDDLAVGCDRRRLYLVSLSRKQRLEPVSLHALDLQAHTPPLARFLAEIARSQSAVVSNFSWGPAGRMPFVPRLRISRTVLSPARWRLRRSELPDCHAPWTRWQDGVHQWQDRRRVPDAVALTEGDRLLPLDLSETAHLAVLRAHLNSAGVAVLAEAATGNDWFGGHAHEIVAPMTAVGAQNRAAAPRVPATQPLSPDHGQLPGASRMMLVKLYSSSERHPEILGGYLPDLLARWDVPPRWWFLRYRDPHAHLRLRVVLDDPAQFGTAASRVSSWAALLRREGLLSEVQFATSYPETGRWGSGVVMEAAEEVFAADSRALAAQFAQAAGPHPQALAAANFVSIAAAFTGGTQCGMDWLIRNGKVNAARPLERPVHNEAVRMADPTGDWAALRAVPGANAVLAAWSERDRALARYRNRLRVVDTTRWPLPMTWPERELHGLRTPASTGMCLIRARLVVPADTCPRSSNSVRS